MTADLSDLVQLPTEDLPRWLGTLGVPAGWRLGRLEGQGPQPSRIAVCPPQSGRGYACDTLTVFSFTGIPADGLAQRLAIPVGEAQQILDAYFVAFPSVHDYMERTVEEARARGYTETLFGRRRQIPELASSNFRIRQAGERQAMNAGIQGLAADIFKVALIRLDRSLEAAGGRSRLILQVHDEVICEVTPDELDAVTALVLDAMSGAFDLRVPLAVNLSVGDSWAAAKG